MKVLTIGATGKFAGLVDRYGISGRNALVLQTMLGKAPRTVKQFIQELKQRRPSYQTA
jgi:hypothetical protein